MYKEVNGDIFMLKAEGVYMTRYRRVIGDDKKVVIPHIVNNEGRWGSGFVLAIDKLSPIPKQDYMYLHAEAKNPKTGRSPLGVGHITPISLNEHIFHMFAQTLYEGPEFQARLSYHSLDMCLHQLAATYNPDEWQVHAPAFGAGLAGGSWNRIDSLIHKRLAAFDVTIFTLPSKEISKKSDAPPRDVHTEHCCVVCGCKYGDQDCTVTNKLKKQSFECGQLTVCGGDF